MIFLYLIAFIPVIVGIVLYICRKDVIWLEWLGSTIIAFLCSAIIHMIVIFGMCGDVEIWSGQISRAVHYPRWVEEYTQVHTSTDSKGNTRVWTTQEHKTHSEHWDAETTIGDDHNISKTFFNEIVNNFNNLTVEKPHKSGFDSGDPNIYVAYNKSGYVYPITGRRSWNNKIKASPSVFSFAKVPKNIPVFEYPLNNDWLKSERLLGNVPINLLEYDRMNSRLGSHKRVNVIIVCFGNKDSSIAKWQQAKWIGGKKNDLVICYGGQKNTQAEWVFCFGWTEKELVKKNIETIFLGNKIDNNIIPKIEQEIKNSYLIKDWSKFDYITIYPPTWSYYVLIFLMIVSQFGFWYWALGNEYGKNNNEDESSNTRDYM
jgi:hypothetical protein